MARLSVDHILRPAPPWRRGNDRTECGLEIGEDRSKVITRRDVAARLRDLGKTRLAMITCITCWETAERWADWSDRPSAVIGREVDPWRSRYNRKERELIDHELEAVAALIEAHPEEFYGYLDGLAQTTSLAEKQARKRWTARATDRDPRRPRPL